MEESRGKMWEGLRLCGRSNLSKKTSIRQSADEDPFCRMMRKVRMILVTYVGSMAVYTLRAVINHIRTSRRNPRALQLCHLHKVVIILGGHFVLAQLHRSE
jgi:hypothetical protein